MRGSWSSLILLCLLWFAPVVVAQPDVPDRLHPRQVFVLRNVDGVGTNRLIFLDLLTGEQQAVDLYGERYTVTPDGVLFYAPGENRVRVVTPDGDVRDHPFVQPRGTTRRVDWLLDSDAQSIVWTLTEGVPGVLTTVTQIANYDGSDRRDVLTDGPRDGIRAMPVAFSADRSELYMDYQPDTIGDYTTFRQYAGLFAVDLDSGSTRALPGEPGCFCGAGLGSDWFLRLALTNNLSGFDLQARQLERGIEQTIPSLPLADYTQGGDILISPDGLYAIYALAQVRNFGTPDQEVQSVLVLVDLNALTQAPLGEVVDFLLRPTAWTEADNAVLLTSPQIDGTWKITLPDGDLQRIADATYLGEINVSP
ncbi:MAG: hypothetical protein SF123_23120 [Chloroflexota bacterium]|nr:hypothetical protein [Chloroflexota bacterium]